jgi:hypothetical protein
MARAFPALACAMLAGGAAAEIAKWWPIMKAANIRIEQGK